MARETTYSGNQVPQPNGAAPIDLPEPQPQDIDTAITINDDGSIEIALGPGPNGDDGPSKFSDNLAKKMEPGQLLSLATDIIEGVSSDIQSRQGFIDNYNKGLDLLGLKIEESTTVRTQRRSISRVGSTILLEAVVKFQAQARAEMLPAAGPVKVAVAGGSTEQQDQAGSDLESDMNYFFTQIDKGFYPDFDRGLFALGFGGNLFKKIYHDPVKRHPLSRSIQIEDFIVSEDAADIEDAGRVTHRFYQRQSEVKKMQLAGAWLDCELGTAAPTSDPTKLKQGSIVGLSAFTQRAQDQEFEFYETYTDLDPDECGLPAEKGAKKGLPLPYVVTVEVGSRQVMSIRRNWREGNENFQKRRRFVHYGLIPSFGFLCLGYLHLLGNQTRAMRAILRIMIDAGMFSQFPGGMKAKGVRTDTNEIAPGPGEWVDVDIGPFDDIKSGFMPMPYKEVSPTLIQLTEMIIQDAQRMGSIPEMEVGEGRTHVPVGTMMSLIEQATQTMASVHKRLHSAMQDELTLIKELFLEDPKALTRLARSPARKWEVASEFENLDLVPASDPNVPSQMHRNMQGTALVALAQGAPQLFDQPAVLRRVLRSMGINDYQTLLAPPQPPQQMPPDPMLQAKMADLQLKGQDLQFRQQDTQRKAANELQQNQQDQRDKAQERQMDTAELASKQRIAAEKEQTARMRFAGEFAQHRQESVNEHNLAMQDMAHNRRLEAEKQAHERGLEGARQQHERGLKAAEMAQNAVEGQAGREHEAGLAKTKPKKKD